MKQQYLDINRTLRPHPYMAQYDDFRDIAARTLHHYDLNAPRFFAGTIDHDVSQNIAALLDAIELKRHSPSSTSAAGRAAT